MTPVRWAAVHSLGPALACALGCSFDPAHVDELGVTALALRPDAPGAEDTPPAYAPSDEVHIHDAPGGFFRVHYTLTGEHAVPPRDADDDGVPDHVAEVGEAYSAVLAFFRDELGFAEPVDDAAVTDGNGGDARFDVYLLDFPNGADGAYRAEACEGEKPRRCPGYMLQENDFDGRGYASLGMATRVLASHELFHAIQHAYRADAGQVISEGTAVWASEAYHEDLDDFEAFIGGYLARPERSLAQEPTGPVDAFAYGSALFFRFLEERHGRAIIRRIWERLGIAAADAGEPDAGTDASAAAWLLALDGALETRHGSSLAEAYAEFAEWNLYTAARADPNLAYAQAASYPEVAERRVELPHADDSIRVFPLAARYYAGQVDQSGDACLAAMGDDKKVLAGLQLVLARETAREVVDVSRGRATHAARVALGNVAPNDTIHAIVINTRMAGASVRPGLCFGPCAAVDRCLEEFGGNRQTDATGAHDTTAGAAYRRSACSLRSGRERPPPAAMLLLAAAFTAIWRRNRARTHHRGRALDARCASGVFDFRFHFHSREKSRRFRVGPAHPTCVNRGTDEAMAK